MVLLALFIGALYGYISVKGQFCMNSGFSNVIRQRDTTKLKSFITAILIQMLILPLLFTVMYIFEPSGTISSLGVPPMFLIGSALGGFFFGIFMYYSAGCGAGIFYKIGEKNTGAVIAVIGFTIGLFLTEKSKLSSLKEFSQDSILISQVPFWTGEHAVILASVMALSSAILLVLLYRKDEKQPKGALWGWKKTGLSIGVVGIMAWGIALGSNNSYGMAIIPGVLDALDFQVSWGVLFVLGVVLGSFISTRKDKNKQFTLPKREIVLKRLFGGFGLGVSGSVAAGCTVGHGLTFAPLLGIGSIISTVFIFLGSGLVGYLTRK